MTRKLKIAQVVAMEASVPPTSQNGLEFVVSWLTESLVRRGHDVTLFAPEGSVTSAKLVSILPKELSNDVARVWQQPARSIWNTSYVSSRASEFDIIHSHTGTIAFTMPFIQTPVVCTLHHPYKNDEWRKYLDTPEHREQMSFIRDQHGKINYVTVSKKQERDFMQAENLFFKKHTCIWNGVPVSDFEYSEKASDYLFYIGYINQSKGADTAVRVAKALNMKLILAGNTYGQEKFFEEKIKPFLNDQIKYVGAVDSSEKRKLYAGALATLSPIAWEEPFGLTIIESQMSGTPVIAFNKGATSELIQDGKTGFVVENETDMIDAVSKIKSIRRADCRAWTLKNFSSETMTDKYEALYNIILGI